MKFAWVSDWWGRLPRLSEDEFYRGILVLPRPWGGFRDEDGEYQTKALNIVVLPWWAFWHHVAHADAREFVRAERRYFWALYEYWDGEDNEESDRVFDAIYKLYHNYTGWPESWEK